MPTTPRLGLPYPLSSAAPNVPLDLQLLAEAIDVAGAPWIDYTPTLGAGWTLGNGVLIGRYRAIGKTVNWVAALTFGSTTALTSTASSIGLPANRRTTGISQLVGRGVCFDASANVRAMVDVVLAGAVVGSPSLYVANAQTITPTVPWTWATGDTIQLGGTYERS